MRLRRSPDASAGASRALRLEKGQSANDLKTSEALIDDEMIKRRRDLIVDGYEFRN